MVGERVLVACSGGRDSVALASVLKRLSSRSKFSVLALAHVDHGPSRHRAVVAYRKKARARVESLAKTLEVEFVSLGPSETEITGEADLREFRLRLLKEAAERLGASAIAFAHHADDLLETRLIRLMRGTGARGLRAMSVRNGLAWRPFLSETRDAIAAYVSDQSLEWVEDPTNRQTGPLRNWIRATLLPLLEEKRSGSTLAIARSFDLLVEELESSDLPREKAILDRPAFESLSKPERKRTLVKYAAGRGDLSSNQVEEVLKRLSSFERQKRREGRFLVAGLLWRISSKEIVATPAANGHEMNSH